MCELKIKNEFNETLFISGEFLFIYNKKEHRYTFFKVKFCPVCGNNITNDISKE